MLRRLISPINRLFVQKLNDADNKLLKLRLTGLCAGIPPATDRFPTQRAGNIESVFMSWRLHDYLWRHDDVIKWKHFPRYWPFVWGIHPVSFDVFFDLRLNKGQVNTREAGDLRRHRAHYDVTIIIIVGWYVASTYLWVLFVVYNVDTWQFHTISHLFE